MAWGSDREVGIVFFVTVQVLFGYYTVWTLITVITTTSFQRHILIINTAFYRCRSAYTQLFPKAEICDHDTYCAGCYSSIAHWSLPWTCADLQSFKTWKTIQSFTGCSTCSRECTSCRKSSCCFNFSICFQCISSNLISFFIYFNFS
jgi:hypothetical protein